MWLDEEGPAGDARGLDLVSMETMVAVKGLIGIKEQKEKCTSQLMSIEHIRMENQLALPLS